MKKREWWIVPYIQTQKFKAPPPLKTTSSASSYTITPRLCNLGAWNVYKYDTPYMNFYPKLMLLKLETYLDRLMSENRRVPIKKKKNMKRFSRNIFSYIRLLTLNGQLYICMYNFLSLLFSITNLAKFFFFRDDCIKPMELYKVAPYFMRTISS